MNSNAIIETKHQKIPIWILEDDERLEMYRFDPFSKSFGRKSKVEQDCFGYVNKFGNALIYFTNKAWQLNSMNISLIGETITYPTDLKNINSKPHKRSGFFGEKFKVIKIKQQKEIE